MLLERVQCIANFLHLFLISTLYETLADESIFFPWYGLNRPFDFMEEKIVWIKREMI